MAGGPAALPVQGQSVDTLLQLRASISCAAGASVRRSLSCLQAAFNRVFRIRQAHTGQHWGKLATLKRPASSLWSAWGAAAWTLVSKSWDVVDPFMEGGECVLWAFIFIVRVVTLLHLRSLHHERRTAKEVGLLQ